MKKYWFLYRKAKEQILSEENDMKIDMITRKLYFGFPVILIGYKDKKWGYNVTTGRG